MGKLSRKQNQSSNEEGESSVRHSSAAAAAPAHAAAAPAAPAVALSHAAIPAAAAVANPAANPAANPLANPAANLASALALYGPPTPPRKVVYVTVDGAKVKKKTCLVCQTQLGRQRYDERYDDDRYGLAGISCIFITITQ